MIVLGFALAALIGLALGLLGGGGSILTVPVLVYVLGYSAKSAIAMSLPVVGVTSLVGASFHWRRGNVRFATAATFGALAIPGAFVGARLTRFMTGGLQLGLLAIVMLVAAASMLRSGRAQQVDGAAEEGAESLALHRAGRVLPSASSPASSGSAADSSSSPRSCFWRRFRCARPSERLSS